MAYNTNNPIGSKDPRDLSDNAENFDRFSNGQELEYPDRLGVPRKSLAGIRAEVTDALSRLGYQVKGEYAPGLVIENYGEVFRKDGEFYRAKPETALPYPLNGDWVVDAPKFVSVGDAVLRDDITDDAGFIGVISPLAGAVRRNLGTRAGDWVSALDFGAVPDGDPETGAGTDNWSALQAALDTGRHVHLPKGIYRVDAKELQFVTSGQILSGEGMGSSYGPSSLRNHRHNTTLMFTGTGERYVKTRRQPRETVSDPDDAPLATAINIQNEGVQLRDFAVFCHCNYAADETVANLGADWDVGIFNGSRAHMILQRVRAIGYWRVASCYQDVTYAVTMPRFTNPRTGQPFPQGTYSGADKCVIEDCWFQGGLKGFFLAGAIETPSGNYYDGVSGATLPNQGDRGGAGCSEYTIERSMLWGREHHSGYRAYDPRVDMNFDLENIELMSAPLVLDGRRGGSTQNRLRRILINNCRFQTFEAVRIGIGRAYEVYFTNINTEATSGTVYTTTGTPITQADPSVNYGPCARVTPSGEAVGADRIFIRGINTPPASAHFQAKGGRYEVSATSLAGNDFYNLGFTGQLQFPQGGFIHRAGTELVIRSSPASEPNGTDMSVLADGMGTLEGKTAARLRVNSQSRLQATESDVIFFVRLRPSGDNTVSFGSGSNRVTEVFAATGTINTSDEREKEQVRDLSEAEREAALELKAAMRAFKWRDAVAEKGEGARWHFGVMAQEVQRIFERHGLDAHAYGLFCYDEWDEQPEVIEDRPALYDDDGVLVAEATREVVQEYRPAGNRYGVRYDQLLAFIIAAL